MNIPLRVKMSFNLLIYSYFLFALSFVSCNAASLSVRKGSDLPLHVKQLDEIFPEIFNTTTALNETHGTTEINGKEVKNEAAKILSDSNLGIGAKSSYGSQVKDGSLTLKYSMKSSNPLTVATNENGEVHLSNNYSIERTQQIPEMIDTSNGKWGETKPSIRTPATISSLIFSVEQKMHKIPSKSIPLEVNSAGAMKVVRKADETKSSTSASSVGSHNIGLIMGNEEKAIPSKTTSEDTIAINGDEGETDVSTPISSVTTHISSMEFRTIEKTDKVSLKSAQIIAAVTTVNAKEDETNTSSLASSVSIHNPSITFTTEVKDEEMLPNSAPSETTNGGTTTVNAEQNKTANILASFASAYNPSKVLRSKEKADKVRQKSAPFDKTSEDPITVIGGKENETVSSTSAHFLNIHDLRLLVYRNLGKEARERLSTSFSTPDRYMTVETKENKDESHSLINQSHGIDHVREPDVTTQSTLELNDSTYVNMLMATTDVEHHESSSAIDKSHPTGSPKKAHNFKVKVIDDKHKNINKSGKKETRHGTEDLKMGPKTHFKDNLSIESSELSNGSLNTNFTRNQNKASQLKSNFSDSKSVKEGVTPGGELKKIRSKREPQSKNITVDEVISKISMKINISMLNHNVSQSLVGKIVRRGNYGGLLIEKMLMKIQKPPEEHSPEKNSKEDEFKMDNLFLKMWDYDNGSYGRNFVSQVPGYASNWVGNIFKRMSMNERQYKK